LDLHDWAGALLEAALAFSQGAALFRLSNGMLYCDRAAGFQGAGPEAPIEVPLHTAPALESAVSGGDTVVALGSATQFSETVAAAFPPPAGGRVVVLPLRRSGETVALLYAAGGDELDLNGLELVAALGSATVGTMHAGRSSMAEEPPLVTIGGVSRQAEPALPPWSQLSRDEQGLHLRAQRFARVQVAEMRLHKSDAVKEGRWHGDLYARLQKEIDVCQEAFREQFMKACPSMVDYLHLELVRTLANEDDALLGPGYGPLV
jgi:hypothetical protein